MLGSSHSSGATTHERLDPVGGLQALEALGQERPAAEVGERLGPVAAEALAAARRDEHRPDARAVPGLT